MSKGSAEAGENQKLLGNEKTLPEKLVSQAVRVALAADPVLAMLQEAAFAIFFEMTAAAKKKILSEVSPSLLIGIAADSFGLAITQTVEAYQRSKGQYPQEAIERGLEALSNLVITGLVPGSLTGVIQPEVLHPIFMALLVALAAKRGYFAGTLPEGSDLKNANGLAFAFSVVLAGLYGAGTFTDNATQQAICYGVGGLLPAAATVRHATRVSCSPRALQGWGKTVVNAVGGAVASAVGTAGEKVASTVGWALSRLWFQEGEEDKAYQAAALSSV